MAYPIYKRCIYENDTQERWEVNCGVGGGGRRALIEVTIRVNLVYYENELEILIHYNLGEL